MSSPRAQRRRERKAAEAEDAQTPREPAIHSGATGVLPEDHPLAHKSVGCDRCGVAVHAANNELMRDWVESGKGNHCWDCFVTLVAEDENGIWETWALPVAYARRVQQGIDEEAQR